MKRCRLVYELDVTEEAEAEFLEGWTQFANDTRLGALIDGFEFVNLSWQEKRGEKWQIKVSAKEDKHG